MWLRIFQIAIFILWAVSQSIFAQDNDHNNKTPSLVAAEQQLDVDKTSNSLLDHKLKSIQHDKQRLQSQNANVDANILHHADLTISLARADLEGITLTLNAAQQAVELTQNNIDTLENQAKDLTIFFRASNQQQSELEIQLKNQRALLALQQDRVKVLQQTKNLGERAIATAQDWKAQLQAKYQLQQQVNRQQALDKLASSLQVEQQEWSARITELNHQLQKASAQGTINSSLYSHIGMAIFEAEERSNLNQIAFDLARLRARFADLAFAPEQILSLSTLNNSSRQMETLYQQLKNTTDMLADKNTLLQKRIKIINQGLKADTVDLDEAQDNLNSLTRLQQSYQSQANAAVDLQNQVHDYQLQLNEKLSAQLGNRQALPGFDFQQWFLLGEKVLQIPALTWLTFHGLQKSFALAFRTAEIWQWIVWPIAMLGLALVGIKLYSYLELMISQIEKRHRDLLTRNSFIVSLKLLQSHLFSIMLLVGFVGLLLMMGLSLQLFSVVIELAVVILAFRLLISLARIALLESTVYKEGSDVRLYHRLKWVLRIGGVITVLTVLVTKLPIAYDIQDIFGRLFMLFLLFASLVLLWGWEVVPSLLEHYLENKRLYLRQMVRWLSLLIPLSFLSNSVIGLLGYVELAWTIAVYQGLFLMVITGYLLTRGLLAESMKFLSERVIHWSRNGWLWSEALLKPLHRVLNVLLFLEAIVVLFKLYGWGTHSLVVTEIAEMLSMHLFVLAGSVITPWNILILLAVVLILIWAARWSREFAYRWLFVNTKDLGLRNSLSIFTQYIIVALGVLIALKMAGINVTALTVIASAFALGIGFGLRDMANNFVSGILLLIERPVRVGDYVTIGNLDGQVMHIGIRSITVTTDDHKELLLPNAEIFSKVFMNWTHRDNIVRTLFTIRVNRNDDPKCVREIILQVIKSIPEILQNPPPEAYFRKMENVLLEFEIEYFLDVRKTPSRWTVHSKVLFLLWERFKVEGIHPPEHPHEILLHSKSSAHMTSFEREGFE